MGIIKASDLTDDPVSHPKHYTQGKWEVIDIIEGMMMDDDYHLANALKYIFRAKHKGRFYEDLNKAIWYLNRRVMKGDKYGS